MKNLLEKIKIYGLRIVLTYLLVEVKRKVWLEFLQGAYGQQGEDLVIDELLGHKKNGFYVDVGAYDPHRFSNTKRFYLRGWRGINIEPNQVNFERFTTLRPRDINLNTGIGNTNAKLTFFHFLPDTLSTFSREEAKKYKKQGYKLLSKKNVNIKTLKSILYKYREDKKIDFFSIDTEGYDLNVLKSNDWTVFSPQVICIESSPHNLKHADEKIDTIHTFLVNKGYRIAYSNDTNSIYKKVD